MFIYFDFNVNLNIVLPSLRFLSTNLYSLTVILTYFYILDICFLSLVVIPVPHLSMSTYTIIRFRNIILLYFYNKYTSTAGKKMDISKRTHNTFIHLS